MTEHDPKVFVQRQNRNMLQAAGGTLALIYHQTVYNLRNEQRNAIIGLLMTIVQAIVFMAAFVLIFLVVGVRTSPLRGDFMLYLMSGIFLFMTHVRAVNAVSTAGGAGALLKHEPLNQAVLIAAAALAVLYRQIISIITILWFYHVLLSPIEIERPVGALAMLLVAWMSGGAVGLVFLSIKPWLPRFAGVASTLYQRVNMFASGKMFVANVLPNFMLPYFWWNPLFHAIDQERGYVFINYTPMKTSQTYALWFTLAVFMIGLLINFTTRKYQSASWSLG